MPAEPPTPLWSKLTTTLTQNSSQTAAGAYSSSSSPNAFILLKAKNLTLTLVTGQNPTQRTAKTARQKEKISGDLKLISKSYVLPVSSFITFWWLEEFWSPHFIFALWIINVEVPLQLPKLKLNHFHFPKQVKLSKYWLTKCLGTLATACSTLPPSSSPNAQSSSTRSTRSRHRRRILSSLTRSAS